MLRHLYITEPKKFSPGQRRTRGKDKERERERGSDVPTSALVNDYSYLQHHMAARDSPVSPLTDAIGGPTGQGIGRATLLGGWVAAASRKPKIAFSAKQQVVVAGTNKVKGDKKSTCE